jgi:hypothetical protein
VAGSGQVTKSSDAALAEQKEALEELYREIEEAQEKRE